MGFFGGRFSYHAEIALIWKIEVVFEDGRFDDVTEELLRFASKDGILEYSATACPLQLPPESKPAFFRIRNTTLTDWRPLQISFGFPFSLQLGAVTDFSACKTKVVYFFNCYVNKKYIYLFSAQLRDLVKTRLLQDTASVLHVVSCGTDQDKVVLAQEIGKTFPAGSDVRHEHHIQNAFEYPGIHKVWELGKEDPDAFILYFHGRGLSRIKLGRFRRNRQFTEKGLFKKVVAEWRENLLWLNYLKSANKVGINYGGNGWIWFNFWWARASYVAGLEEPIVTDRRHYYEDWLGRWVVQKKSGAKQQNEYADTMHSCVGIASSRFWKKYNIGSDYHPEKGETNLGLPLGALRMFLFRLRKRVKALFAK